MSLQIILPEKLASKLKELNVDPEAYVICAVVTGVQLDALRILKFLA